jgi:predicted nucleic acid-binding Zn ribbon protein
MKICEVCGNKYTNPSWNSKFCSDECRTINKNKQLEKYQARDYLYEQYKIVALQRKKEFKLSLDEFWKLKDSPCHYCGSLESINGIDRYDSRKGYTPENSVPCCFFCNNMKWILSEEQFIKQCTKIVIYQNNK